MLLVVLLLCTEGALGLNIYVGRQQNNQNSSTCWQVGDDLHCKTFGMGLEQLSHYNASTLWVAGGVYHLNQSVMAEDWNDMLDESNGYSFIWMADIAISVWNYTNTALDPSALPVRVQCDNGTGLSFIYVTNVTIKGVEFSQCGALQNSTSRVSANMEFHQFYAALYFLYASDVTLEFVHVTGTPGTGVVMYATVGKNLITNSGFSFNAPGQLTNESGGGGLYIEFPYCTPDLQSCTLDSAIPQHYVSNSEYVIESCEFFNNTARVLDEIEFIFIIPQLDKHLAFGRGGGLSVFFKGHSVNNSIQVRSCSIANNTALWGGGLFVEFQDMSSSNNFSMEASKIENNHCLHHASESKGSGGGGARVGYIFFNKTHVYDNHMTFVNVNFTGNKAYYGGGLSLYSSREPTEAAASNTLDFCECIWTRNLARVGSGVDMSVWHPQPYGAIIEPSFTGCAFINNTAQYTKKLGQFVGLGAVYSDFIPVSFYGGNWFLQNTATALVCIGARIRFQRDCKVVFCKNSGRSGGAVALMGYSFLEVSQGTRLSFVGNTAEIAGGAIFGQSIGEHNLISSRNCFIRYEDFETPPEEWNTTFYFKENIANEEVNSIYATSLLSCYWGRASGSASVVDVANRVFCWNSSLSDPKLGWIYWNSSCKNEIATSPAKFVANGNVTEPCSGDRACNISIKVIPGLRTSLPLFTEDDRGNSVVNATVLIARVINGSENEARIDTTSLYISDNSIELYGRPNNSAIIKLETIAPRVISTQIRVNFTKCPPGMIMDYDSPTRKCVCKGNYMSLVYCHSSRFFSELRRGAWMGSLGNGSSSHYVVGSCPYCSPFTQNRTLKLPQEGSKLESVLCHSINRTGTLCGKCLEGYGVFVNGYGLRCRPCPASKELYNWVFYLMTEFLPITIFFFIVILFNVSVTSGPANAFVFFAQVLTTVFKIDGDGAIALNRITSSPNHLTASYLIPYDIWNQNFFHPFLPNFCLSSRVSTLQVLSTGYITALYPLLLVLVFSGFVWAYGRGFKPVVCLCRPIHRCFMRLWSIWNLQRSIVHALATFIILSYTKFTLVSFVLLTQTPLYDNNGKVKKRVLYYDGTIDYLGKEHIPYVIASALALMTFVALPPIILTAPSILLGVQKLSRKFFKKEFDLPACFDPGAGFSQFLNAFHGCYKDGTGGSSDNNIDCRWFAGFYFILRLLLFLVFAFTPYWFLQYVIQQLICIVALLTFVIFRPYKSQLFNIVDVCIFANLAAISTLSMFNYYLTTSGDDLVYWPFVVQYILIFLPLVYIVVYVMLLLWKKSGKCVYKKKMTAAEEDTNFMEFADEEEERHQNVYSSYQRIVEEKANSPVNRDSATINSQERSSSHDSSVVHSTDTSGYGATDSSRQLQDLLKPPQPIKPLEQKYTTA